MRIYTQTFFLDVFIHKTQVLGLVEETAEPRIGDLLVTNQLWITNNLCRSEMYPCYSLHD